MVKGYKPESLIQALEYIASEECTIFAGGTDLMVKHKEWSGMEPEFSNPVVFISDIAELKEIKVENGYILIGSAATCSDICRSSLIPRYFKDVVSSMASLAIRNAATIGGNICNSSPAGDIIPLLYALDAVVCLKSTDGLREVKIQDFFLGPGKNILKKQELLIYVKVPDEVFDIHYLRKVGTRNANSLSKLSFVGMAKKCNNRACDVRIAFGAVGPTVIRDRGIENVILEMKDMMDAKAMAELYRDIIKPIDDQRSTAFYRREVCIRLVEDFLKYIVL